MLWSKHVHFSNFLFLGNIGKENVFYDILERKNAFLGYKNKKSKSRKIDIFSKGLTHEFGPKMGIFPTFFVQQFIPGKCVLRYFRTKKRLSRLLKQEVKKVEKLTFFQRVYGIGPKMAFFPDFLVRQYRPGKCLSRYSRTKKRLSRL